MTVSIMSIGAILLTACGAGLGGRSFMINYIVAQFVFGYGVGGEYPMAAGSAAERAEAGGRAKAAKRGMEVVLTFSMQGAPLPEAALHLHLPTCQLPAECAEAAGLCMELALILLHAGCGPVEDAAPCVQPALLQLVLASSHPRFCGRACRGVSQAGCCPGLSRACLPGGALRAAACHTAARQAAHASAGCSQQAEVTSDLT